MGPWFSWWIFQMKAGYLTLIVDIIAIFFDRNCFAYYSFFRWSTLANILVSLKSISCPMAARCWHNHVFSFLALKFMYSSLRVRWRYLWFYGRLWIRFWCQNCLASWDFCLSCFDISQELWIVNSASFHTESVMHRRKLFIEHQLLEFRNDFSDLEDKSDGDEIESIEVKFFERERIWRVTGGSAWSKLWWKYGGANIWVINKFATAARSFVSICSTPSSTRIDEDVSKD